MERAGSKGWSVDREKKNSLPEALYCSIQNEQWHDYSYELSIVFDNGQYISSYCLCCL